MGLLQNLMRVKKRILKSLATHTHMNIYTQICTDTQSSIFAPSGHDLWCFRFRVVFSWAHKLLHLLNYCTFTHALQKPDPLYPLHVFSVRSYPLNSDPSESDPVILVSRAVLQGCVFMYMCMGVHGTKRLFRVFREGRSQRTRISQVVKQIVAILLRARWNRFLTGPHVFLPVLK